MPNPALPFSLYHCRCRCSYMFPIFLLSPFETVAQPLLLIGMQCNSTSATPWSSWSLISDRSLVLYGEMMKMKMNYEIGREWCWRWGRLGCSSLLTPLHVAGTSDGRPRPWGRRPWHLRGASCGSHLTGIVLQVVVEKIGHIWLMRKQHFQRYFFIVSLKGFLSPSFRSQKTDTSWGGLSWVAISLAWHV